MILNIRLDEWFTKVKHALMVALLLFIIKKYSFVAYAIRHVTWYNTAVKIEVRRDI